MCGIAGFFNWNIEAPAPVQALKRASNSMLLRGPDADGFYEKHGVGFVHRRLTVIDLSGGWQPMTHRGSGVCLTYNGEIYNFKALREELIGLGHVFESMSDTEVLLHAYLQWGRGCVDRLVGIFAFGVFDPRDGSLLLVRDRMGTKPLYFAETRDGIAFGSSVAAVQCFDGVGNDVDQNALLHYFCSIRSTLGSSTMLKDIKTVEPGSMVVSQRKGRRVDVFAYWEFPIVRSDEKQDVPSLGEAVETVRAMVKRSVKEQMVSDVPLGGFLSGGIDSTIIASLASEHGQYGAYNVGYGEHDCNEWSYVRLAAEYTGIECKEIHLGSEGFVDTWNFLIGEKGLPLSTPNEIPIHYLAKALKQDYTVALSGEGADEIFGGYIIPYFAANDFDRARHEPLAENDLPNSVDRAMIRQYGQPFLRNHLEHHFMLNAWMPQQIQQALLVPELEHNFTEVMMHYQGQFDRFEGCSTLDKYMHLHARINLEGLLNRVDSSTMSASVEARVPFTDHRIAEFLYRMPDEYRMAWRDEVASQQGRIMNVSEIDQRNLLESKKLLRRAFSGEVPAEIMKRRKVSFPVPFREWLGGSMRDFAADTLAGSGLVEGLVQKPALMELINGAENPGYAMQLWPLVNLALWEKNCLHGECSTPNEACRVGAA